MRYLSNRALEVYLAREVLGKPMQRETVSAQPKRRKPIAKKRKGPPRREKPLRDKAYKRWIRTLPSIVSERYGCDPAHTGTDGGARQKASDDSCVPLTREEHREYHQMGRAAFAQKHGLDFPSLCRELRAAYLRARKKRVRGRKYLLTNRQHIGRIKDMEATQMTYEKAYAMLPEDAGYRISHSLVQEKTEKVRTFDAQGVANGHMMATTPEHGIWTVYAPDGHEVGIRMNSEEAVILAAQDMES